MDLLCSSFKENKSCIRKKVRSNRQIIKFFLDNLSNSFKLAIQINETRIRVEVIDRAIETVVFIFEGQQNTTRLIELPLNICKIGETK